MIGSAALLTEETVSGLYNAVVVAVGDKKPTIDKICGQLPWKLQRGIHKAGILVFLQSLS
jgi:hypothetical protein